MRHPGRAVGALVLLLAASAASAARGETRPCADLLAVDLTDVGGAGSRVQGVFYPSGN